MLPVQLSLASGVLFSLPGHFGRKAKPIFLYLCKQNKHDKPHLSHTQAIHRRPRLSDRPPRCSRLLCTLHCSSSRLRRSLLRRRPPFRLRSPVRAIFIHRSHGSLTNWSILTGPQAINGVENLKVVTKVINTGDETLKLLNDPRGVLHKVPTNTFEIVNTNTGTVPQFDGIKVCWTVR